MIIVDTSVLVDFLKDQSNSVVDKFTTILDLKTPFGITSHIYQELLQGMATQNDFNTLKKYLDTFTVYSPRDKRGSYSEAAHIYFLCKREGITIRSTIDCLIAQIALEHNCQLLHNDKDFDNLKKVVPRLKFF